MAICHVIMKNEQTYCIGSLLSSWRSVEVVKKSKITKNEIWEYTSKSPWPSMDKSQMPPKFLIGIFISSIHSKFPVCHIPILKTSYKSW